MNIKIITKTGKSRVLKVDNFKILEKIANKFDNWEYKL
jgi:hypothetical protein